MDGNNYHFRRYTAPDSLEMFLLKIGMNVGMNGLLLLPLIMPPPTAVKEYTELNKLVKLMIYTLMITWQLKKLFSFRFFSLASTGNQALGFNR